MCFGIVRRKSLAALLLTCALGCRSQKSNEAGRGDAELARPSASIASTPAASSSNDPRAMQETPPAPPGARTVVHPPSGMPEPAAPPSRTTDAGSVSPVAIFDSYGFPPQAKVEHLCAQRVYDRTGGHVTWDAFASPDPPEKLVTHYKARLGEAGFSAHGSGGIWRLPAGQPTPRRTLDVLSTSDSGPYQRCERKPGPAARSVLVLTRWF
jgi:hypothetical protein